MLVWCGGHPALGVCVSVSLCVCVFDCVTEESIFCAVITACVFLSVWLAGFHAALLPTPCLTRPLTDGDLNTALEIPP